VAAAAVPLRARNGGTSGRPRLSAACMRCGQCNQNTIRPS
jgi:hypothetical protein